MQRLCACRLVCPDTLLDCMHRSEMRCTERHAMQKLQRHETRERWIHRHHSPAHDTASRTDPDHRDCTDTPQDAARIGEQNDFGDDTNAEVDLYGGFSNEVSGIGYDVGVIYYGYPGGDDINFLEIQGSLTFGPVTGGVNYIVDSQVDDTSAGNETFIDGDIYYHVSASFEVAPTWTVGGTVGYFDFKDDGVAGSDTSYTHYQLDIGKSAGDLGDFTFSVSAADEESGDSDAKVFVSWAKTFD